MASEQRTFVFSVTFLILFSALLTSIPVGLQGEGVDPDNVTPLNPTILSGFSESETFVRSNFSVNLYLYDLNSRTWLVTADDVQFTLAAKIFIAGFLWLGQLDVVKFKTETTDRGNVLTLAEIEADSDEGLTTYSLTYETTGTSAGSLICYYNTTLYADASTAWLADGLYLTHGVGLAETASFDVGLLLMNLLFLQLPEVPVLINLILALPVWAGIVFIIWYLIKEMIPFV